MKNKLVESVLGKGDYILMVKFMWFIYVCKVLFIVFIIIFCKFIFVIRMFVSLFNFKFKWSEWFKLKYLFCYLVLVMGELWV